ncbi:coiled-coil domain-containing protein 146 isoform X2 [Cynoglossus semilaevis]|uniref:coiled-coil domain-containing protein 146 isoform X2 n=1 Tax=Cynoglossus semilaevis TaxID=244447 RepID=UPI000D62D86B|nr:coiled-coil domain-containing protein 146 isoform X2 [Cynoglossus semilaevis]
MCRNRYKDSTGSFGDLLSRYYVSLSEEEVSMTSSRGEMEVREQVKNKEEEEGMKEDFPLVALAPDASLPEEQLPVSTDVCVCPVSRCIDELLLLDQIDTTRVTRLKTSYRHLQDTLKSSQDCELQRLEEAKRCRAELQRVHAELEKTEEQSTSEEPESEVKELRQQLLQAYNELKTAENTEYKTQHQLKCLWEEKLYLDKETETQSKAADLESRKQALQKRSEDLRKEVSQRQLEVSLTDDLKACEHQIQKTREELEDKKKTIEIKEAEKAQLISVPGQILAKIERKRSQKEAAMRQMEELKGQISEMEEQVKKAEEFNHSLRMKKEEVMQRLQVLQARLEAGQKESRQLLKEQAVNKEEQAEMYGARGILELKLQNIMCDRKHLFERQSVQLREKNRQMQTLKRTQHALTFATEQLQHTQTIYSDLQAQLEAVAKSEDSIQQKMELQKEVDVLRVGFEKQLLVAEKESRRRQQYGTIQELLGESNQLREELHNLRCLTKIKAEERGQKHRDLLRAEQLQQFIHNEVREKHLIITDQNKLNAMLQNRLIKYSKLCDMITEEKTKYVRLKQIASQTITELMEQLKVLENETEIQRSIVVNKDRSLTKSRMKLSNCSTMRDKLRNNISKVAWKHHQISEQIDDNKLELVKLTQMINLQEQALVEMNKNHENAVQHRNFLGIQLLEHEEVIFNYHEKVRVQEAAITKGSLELETLEKEVRDLKTAINEGRRQLELRRKEVPVNGKLEGELVMLQIELSEARDKTIECLSRTVDYKETKGNDPSTVDLVKKVEQLEATLAERERQLLEKQLLVEQVTRLSKPLSERVENCQEDRLSVAKKLNELRTDINNANRQLMAISAELSVKQAAALAQQQEISERELQMEMCQRRLEQGLPPCPEMEEEWRRMLRDKRRRQRDKEEKDKLAEEDEWNRLPNGEYTTAETRPNAYVPQDELLPLPKPYGAQAPFKPVQPGANMRHFRKPTMKPLEM